MILRVTLFWVFSCFMLQELYIDYASAWISLCWKSSQHIIPEQMVQMAEILQVDLYTKVEQKRHKISTSFYFPTTPTPTDL